MSACASRSPAQPALQRAIIGMKIREIRIHSIQIPFTHRIAHGKASRSFCDSFIVEVASDSGKGYGEALVREYVSGALGGTTSGTDRLAVAAGIVQKLASPLALEDISWPLMRSYLETAAIEVNELPILCGLEGALLDCACREAGTDIFGLLEMRPRVTEIVYGGTLPIVPKEAMSMFIGLFRSFGVPNLRVKLGQDPSYADSTLRTAREAFGDGFDLRVDANASWSYNDFLAHIPVLRKHGVNLIEEPFGRGREENLRFVGDPSAKEFQLAADESALTPDDVRAIAAAGAFRIVNIRLAKNGGILRALRMRAAAWEHGLAIQVGCHVGETGILSAAGRATASLMPDALYVDGSYDEHLLSGNITTENFTFGIGGRAPVITGRRLGFEVDRAKLEEYSNDERACL